MRQIVIVGLLAASSAAGVCAQTDSNSVWSAVSAGAMDPAKTAVTENVEMVRDRVHITLVSGTIQFGQPANGVVFAAVFHGEGRVQVEPPNAIEAQQLRLFTKEDKINYKFSDATFSFTDDLMEEVGKQVKWKGGGPASDELYTNRQKFREDMGQAVIPRLVQGIMATDRKRSAYFLADLKVGDKHWVDFDEDAQSPEEMTIGRWVDVGPVRIFDTWMSFPSGGRSSADAWKDPLSKRDFTIPRYSIDASVTSGRAERDDESKSGAATGRAKGAGVWFRFESASGLDQGCAGKSAGVHSGTRGQGSLPILRGLRRGHAE